MVAIARPARAGFTLVEVVAVLAVLGVTATLVVPRWMGWDAAALDAVAWREAERISTARTEAILAGEDRTLALAPAPAPEVRMAGLDLGGMPISPAAPLTLHADGDPLPRRVTLADRHGNTRIIVVPAGFARAHVEEAPRR
jgi:prepilin-type N-terminal cleavage/methylation domain-containing protein